MGPFRTPLGAIFGLVEAILGHLQARARGRGFGCILAISLTTLAVSSAISVDYGFSWRFGTSLLEPNLGIASGARPFSDLAFVDVQCTHGVFAQVSDLWLILQMFEAILAFSPLTSFRQ
jgi:hypothetical protein